MRILSIVILAGMLLFTTSTHAQQILQVLGPNPVIAGVPVQCGGAIAYVAQIPDIAYALPGRILLRPDFFSLPPYMQLFVYAHECGHQIVESNEPAADCWAVKLGRNQGWLPPVGLQQVCAFTFPTPGSWTHMPGPARCQQMIACYNTP